MNANESNVDDLSQQISESYLHLSQDDPPSDTTSSIEYTSGEENYYNTSKLMRLAKAIDGEFKENVNSKADIQQDKRSTEVKESNIDGNKYHMTDSPRISSHSTPILPKNYGLKFEKFPDLSQIDESIEKDENLGLDNILPNNQELPQSSSGSDNAYEPVFSLLNKDVDELNDIKKIIDFVIRQKTQKTDKKQRSPKKLFTTPIRNNFDNGLDSSADDNYDDDDLSLKDGRRTVMEMQRDRENISPITTPPQSQELFETSINKTQLTEFDGVEQDTSYIPKWAKMSRNISPEIHMAPLGEPEEHLNSRISTLKKEMDDLKSQTVTLQKENLDLRGSIDDIKTRSLHKQPQFNESEIESRMNQFLSEIKILESNNQQMKASLDKFQIHNEELKNEVNYLSERLNELNREGVIETPPKIEEDLLQGNDKFDNCDNINTFQNNSNINFSNNTVIAEESVGGISTKTEFTYLYGIINEKDSEIKDLKSNINSLLIKLGDEQIQLTEKTVDSKFKDYYRKLQLMKIDSLSKTDVSNLLKNLLLSLLISDYDNLPGNAVKYGKFLRIAIQFLDTLHDRIYDSEDKIKPSYYLKDGSSGNIENLSICLDGMLNEINL